MAAVKKTAVAGKTDKIVDVKSGSGVLTLSDISKIVNTMVDSVFVERNGKIEFAAELYEILLAYLEIGAFYPETGVLENSVELFFVDYINDKYSRELSELALDRTAQYIDGAVKRKIEFRMRQVENPLVNSMVKLIDIASVLGQKYVDDIDKIGTSDIKGFIEDFAKLAKVTNPQTVTDAVIKLHKAENSETDGAAPAAGKKRASKKSGNAVK